MIFVIIQITIVRTHRTLHTWTMLGGATSVLLGNILWLIGIPIHRLVWWWGIFLVLTIAGERLELGRIIRLSILSKVLFTVLCILAGLGLLATGIHESQGYFMIGVSLFGLGVWFLRFDIARRILRPSVRPYPPITRYIDIALMLGFIWLALSGMLILLFGFSSGGVMYDAILHMLFIGFVFSMIFGHAPIILPSIFSTRFIFNPILYIPLLLLHLSLVLRIFGDLSRQASLRLWGGLINGITILLFMGMMFAIILVSNKVIKRSS